MMKNIAVLIFLTLTISIFAEPQLMRYADSTSDAFTLESAIDWAMKNNERMNIAAQQYLKSKSKIKEYNAALGPALGITGTYTHNDEEGTTLVPVGVSGSDLIFSEIVTQKLNTFETKGNLSMPIDLNGVLGAQKDVGIILSRISEQELLRVKQQLTLDVKSAYFNVLRSAALLDVAEQSLNNSKQRLSVTQSFLSAGTGTKFDVIRAETQVSANEQSLIAAKNGLDIAKRIFNSALGRPINTPVALYEMDQLPEMPKDLNELQALANANRPELKQVKENLNMQTRLVRVAQRINWPYMTLSGSYTYNPDIAKETSWRAMAILSWTVWDSGKAQAMYAQQKNEVKIAQDTLKQTSRGISLDVEQAYLNLLNSSERLKVAQAGSEQAKEGLRLARVRFENGASIQVEVSDAELANTQAQTNLVNSKYEYLTAYANLIKAIGEDK